MVSEEESLEASSCSAPNRTCFPAAAFMAAEVRWGVTLLAVLADATVIPESMGVTDLKGLVAAAVDMVGKGNPLPLLGVVKSCAASCTLILACGVGSTGGAETQSASSVRRRKQSNKEGSE